MASDPLDKKFKALLVPIPATLSLANSRRTVASNASSGGVTRYIKNKDENTTGKVTRLTENKVKATIPGASPHTLDASQLSSADKVITPSQTILGENVLNDYVSYTYIFTLSGLRTASLTNPTLTIFKTDSDELTILKSTGKGTDYKISPGSDGSANAITNNRAKEIIDEFNADSPGRFDMYIDNVEIESLMGYSGKSGPTLPTKFRFDVFEPYSMNGFIEALQATALASGYVDYVNASYLLKMEFIGYKEGGILDPKIPNSTRYFGIQITKVQLEVNENGTKYTCVGIPFNEYGFSDEINKLRQNVQVEGHTVGTVLENLMSNVMAQRFEADRAASSIPPASSDEYKIVFGDANSTFDRLSKSPLGLDTLKDSRVIAHTNPQSDKNRNAYQAKGIPITDQSSPLNSSVMNFAVNSNITDCISAVISESMWGRNLLKNLKTNYDPKTGMVNYFIVRVSVENKKFIDVIRNRPYQKFTYIVSPYKIHYTLIPAFQQEKFKYSNDIKERLILRDYSYIYTGENIDILDFKINFNNAYYAMMPNAMGITKSSTVPTSVGQEKLNGMVINNSAERLSNRTLSAAVPGMAVNPDLGTNYDNRRQLTAVQPQADPWHVLSKTMYESLVNNATDMIKVDLGIIGDPVYLATGGIGNYNPESSNGIIKDSGEINQNYGMTFIKINFKNPVDIQEDGFLDVNKIGRIQFGGVFLVRKVVSKFSSGMFTQKLELSRMPQIDGGTDEKSDATSSTDTKTINPGAEPPLTSAGAAERIATDFATPKFMFEYGTRMTVTPNPTVTQ
jgi:hypothetical protein